MVGEKNSFVKAQAVQLIVFCNYNLTVYQDIKAGRLFPEVDKGEPVSDGFRKSTLSFAECKQCYISEIVFEG